MTKKIEIIIVSYNQPEMTKRCVRSVKDYTKLPHTLTVYNNLKENKNLGQLWNELIAKSKADYICLLNDDALVEPEWLEKLMEIFAKEDNVGAVGPTTSSSVNQQSKEFPTAGYEIVDFTEKYPGWCLSGFCLIFPKAVWADAGGFPEDFGFYGQEVALLDKISHKGYRQIWRKDVLVWHYGSASVRKAQQEGKMNEDYEREIARKKFYELRKELADENKHL